MRIKYPDYENCISGLAGSILKEFGVETTKSLALCDKLLEKKYKNVVVLLLDGMGQSIIERNLAPDGFLRTHLTGNYSSVFPPTTVAATTSIDSGKEPVEHAWLGWDCYYKEIDKNVTVFRNTESGTEKPAADFPVAWTYCPYQSTIQQIQNAGGQAYYATPFMKPYPADFAAICKRIRMLCATPGKKYIYAYWNEPDHTMHRTGCYSEQSKQVLRELEEQVEELCAELSDTLLLITADHGHMDSAGVAMEDYPELTECLVRMPSIEPRALNLFVKPGMEEIFAERFRREFGEKFLLLTKREVKERKLFGTGTEHARFDEMLGDYLAVAVDDLSIYNTREERDTFIGVHAGLTEEELMIPLIAVRKGVCETR
ncbi:MAG: alkaline phosphatase family protein [Lachnospiraceae bacterium]|nr:alkaline phosphatase family protein [Lachnospiraceae bacterium]